MKQYQGIIVTGYLPEHDNAFVTRMYMDVSEETAKRLFSEAGGEVYTVQSIAFTTMFEWRRTLTGTDYITD